MVHLLNLFFLNLTEMSQTLKTSISVQVSISLQFRWFVLIFWIAFRLKYHFINNNKNGFDLIFDSEFMALQPIFHLIDIVLELSRVHFPRFWIAFHRSLWLVRVYLEIQYSLLSDLLDCIHSEFQLNRECPYTLYFPVYFPVLIRAVSLVAGRAFEEWKRMNSSCAPHIFWIRKHFTIVQCSTFRVCTECALLSIRSSDASSPVPVHCKCNRNFHLFPFISFLFIHFN